MGYKAETLEASLRSLLNDPNRVKRLSDNGILLDYKRLYIGVKYLNSKNIPVVNSVLFTNLSDAIQDNSVSDADFKLATSDAELALLDSLNGALDGLTIYGGETRKEKKSAKATEKEVLTIASEILPSALNRAYDIMLDYGQDGKVYDKDGNMIFDFESFIDKINKSAHSTSVVNNLPTLSLDATKKYEKVVKENAREFLMMLPAIEQKIDKLVLTGEERPKVTVNSDIRKVRRDSRPVDKKGNLLPSYLDYINDDGSIVPYSEFVKTPSGRILKEFKNEDEYNGYATSTAFWSYVSHLERPLSEEVVNENVVPHFYILISEDEAKAFAKESVILPSKAYRQARQNKNNTVEISKLKDEKALKALNRVVAGALSIFILAAAIASPVNDIIESIKENQIQSGPNDDKKPPIEDESTMPEETITDNVEIMEDPEEIVDNPAEGIAPPEEEETTAPEEDVTSPEEEVTTPEEDTTPEEETTVPEEEVTTPEETTEPEEDPSKDNPETEVPDHNDIDEDRREQDDEDSFWFE